MEKIGIFGDLHLDDRSPVNRVDDYLSTGLKKLDFCLSQVDTAIFLGDFFNKGALNFLSMHALIEILLKHKALGKKIFTILGNHDLFMMSEATINKTSIGLLELMGLINIIRETTIINGIEFEVIPLKFKFGKDSIKKAGCDKAILLGHHFYDSIIPGTANESFDKKAFGELGYQAVFLGHDHCPYSPVKQPNCTIYRPGAILRNAAFEYNLSRDFPIYYELDISGEKINAIEKQVTVAEKATEVFTDSVYDKKNTLKSEAFLFNIESLVNSFAQKNNINENTSVQKILIELDAPEPVIDYIKSLYLQNEINFI